MFLSKTGQNSNEVRMCHTWFWIDYFILNLHLIIKIYAHIWWRSEFITVRPLCWEITRNNAVNYFEFCLVFDKDSYIFERAMLARHLFEESQLGYNLRPCIPGLIIVQKYHAQNLDVNVINRKLLIYFSLFQAFSWVFLLFCFCWYGEYWRKWNIRKCEPQCELQYA